MLRLTPEDKEWPAEFTHIDPLPERLWLRGREELLTGRPRVAIVGSRAPTPYGEAQARRFATSLAKAGVTVVSGLARGVDAAAHAGALDAGGATIGVLGCGVDRPWPAGPLAERMTEEGLLLSEFAPGQEPRKHHFPLRNRLISALADAVVVIEAAFASGSLITAHWAADQGRPVFALPGRVDHPMARGCHRLIREGAELLESPAEVLREIGQPKLPFDKAPEVSAPRDTIETLLVGETLTSNELAARLGLSPQALLPRLAELELEERLVRAPGGLWRLAEAGG
jgi:DNA processing protein